MGKNITIAVLAVLLLTLGVYAYTLTDGQTRHLAYMENGSENEFLSLDDALSDMSNDLEIITVSNDDTFICTKLAEITKTASHAQKAITALPISHNTALNATDFLSLCEDYSHTLMLSLINGGTLSESDKAALAQLSENCALLSEGTSTFGKSRTDDFRWHSDEYEFITDSENTHFVKLFSDFEDNYSDFEGITYNGKYSSEKETAEYLPNENTPIYDYKLIENSLTDKYKDTDGITVSYLNKDNAVKGQSANYHSFEINDGSSIMRLDYDIASGNLLKARSGKTSEDRILSDSQVREKASEYLKEMGISSVSETYFGIDDNIATVRYVYENNGILYYPNSVSISISMQNGELTGFDAENYYKYPTPAESFEPDLSIKQAEENLAENLQVIGSKLVVISMNDQSERYAYEFEVSKNDTNYKILLDAQTGEELMITKTEKN